MTVVALLLSLAFALQPPATSRGGAVAGRILTRDGVPAPAVRVAAIPAPPPEARPEDDADVDGVTVTVTPPRR
jgi:hypothetical protein